MATLSRSPLSDQDIAKRMVGLQHWEVKEGLLTRLFEYESYFEGVVFAAAVAQVAERLDHHPDIFIGYRKVRVQTCTHDAGNQLTELDFALASRIDSL